jgi:hypothetical protein
LAKEYLSKVFNIFTAVFLNCCAVISYSSRILQAFYTSLFCYNHKLQQ